MSGGPTEGDELRGYLDTASGIPPSEVVRRALLTASSVGWPDPGRRYPSGRAAGEVLDQSRASVARSLGVTPEQVVFPSSMEQAVWLALTAFLDEGRGLLVSAVEDLAVIRAADQAERQGAAVRQLPVDRRGRLVLAELEAAAEPSVVVVQDANAEIGTRQPLAQIRSRVPADTPLVVDARAVLGREPITPHWDVLIADPRMWGGPAGPALLVVREPARFRPWGARTDGALGVEPATPAVPAIAAGALALELALSEGPWQVTGLVDRLRTQVRDRIPDVEVLGDPDERVGYLAMFSVWYVPADELVDELARRGWSVASGASCTSDTRRPHHVLVAIGAPTHGSLRVSIGPWTTEAELDRFAADLVEIVGRIRAESGVAGL